MRRTVRALLVPALTVLILLAGVLSIRIHYQSDIGKWDFDRIEQYQNARKQPDKEIYQLTMELKTLEASVQGSVVLIFDQCTSNLYDKVFLHMSEYGMTGSVIFRDVLPGDEGAITEEQWQEMQQLGWSAMLGADDHLLSTLEEEGYTERLRSYVLGTKDRFAEKELSVPISYGFSAGEYNEENVAVLMENGYKVFSSSEAETGMIGNDAAVYKEFYISSDPNAPLLQSTVESIKNKAQVLSIKTRYVDWLEDVSKDIQLDKFRWGMLRSLSTYRVLESLRIEPADVALENYKEELAKLDHVENERQVLLAKIEEQNRELLRLWQYYRS